MNRPFVLCHMLTSLDGKVTGDFLNHPKAEHAIKRYYKMHKEFKFNAFACGRVTMEESFTKGYYPDLSEFSDEPMEFDDNIDNPYSMFYAICFDRKGKLGWKSNQIIDEDDGYNKAAIIEVLTEQVDIRYLRYLKSLKIPYIFAGKDEIDINLALKKLYHYFNINKLLLEGGSIINGAFLKADAIDEVNVVVAPLIGNSKDKPLFYECDVTPVTYDNSKKFRHDVLNYNYYINHKEFIRLNDTLENQIKNYRKLKDKLNNATNVSDKFVDKDLKFLFNYSKMILDENKCKLNHDNYECFDLVNIDILQPLLINVLAEVLCKEPLFIRLVLDRKYHLFVNKNNKNKTLIKHSEYVKNMNKYNSEEYEALECCEILKSLLDDVNFNSNIPIINLLNQYGISKEDFFVKKILIVPELFYAKEDTLSKCMYYRLIVRNNRLSRFLKLDCPRLVKLTEQRLIHKALFDLCEQLY